MNRTRTFLSSTALAVALTGGLAACSSGTTTGTPAVATPAPTSSTATSPTATTPTATSSASEAVASGTLTAATQTSDGKSLTVKAVTLTGVDQGWVAVHMDAGGKPGPVVGEVAVKKGANSNVVIHFDKAVTTGDFWPMLHVDDHTVGTYEFPKVAGADLPVKAGSDVVMQKITLTVR